MNRFPPSRLVHPRPSRRQQETFKLIHIEFSMDRSVPSGMDWSVVQERRDQREESRVEAEEAESRLKGTNERDQEGY
jgi:hypothetical protein